MSKLSVQEGERMYSSRNRLIIFDADGTLIDAFPVVERAFARHGMDIGTYERFQRRRKLLKYAGGLREFPKNLRHQFDKASRKQIRQTLTEIYREEAQLFPGLTELLGALVERPDVVVGIVSRNVTIAPEETLATVLRRHGIDSNQLDFLHCIRLGDRKAAQFRAVRQELGINPLRAMVCGDEYADYSDAIAAGMHAQIVSYGFEDHGRLSETFGIPTELIARTPADLKYRLGHALDVEQGTQREPTS
jgi:phosphoglycolate phosphatase